MNNIAINATGLLITATGIFAFTFLLLAQHHLEKPAQSTIRWIAFGVSCGVYSVTRVWLAYASTNVFAGGRVPVQSKYGALVAGALMVLIVISQLIRLHRVKRNFYIRLYTIGIACTILTLSMYIVNFFQTVGFIHVMVMTTIGLAGFIFPGYAAFKIRSRYPGTSVEALITVGGLFAIIVTIVMMATTNVRAERSITANQSDVISHLVERQAVQHLTKDAFDPDLAKGKTQLASFIEEVTIPEMHRIKIIRNDGLVLASDLARLVGTRELLTGSLGEAMKGQRSTVLVKTAGDLPPSEQSFGSASVVTVPLEVPGGQPVGGAAQLFLDAPAALAALQSLQDAINFAGVVLIFTVILIMLVLMRVVRRSISRPFADILDEVRHIHVATDSGEHRRIKVKHQSDFTAIADSFNILINEYEERIRELEKEGKIHEKS